MCDVLTQGLFPQILKQAELRELRKTKGEKESLGGRAPKPLEAKWRLNVGRSPLCEGCGGATMTSRSPLFLSFPLAFLPLLRVHGRAFVWRCLHTS